ncbi:hypothetical protein ZWY2020_008218, partial [Hordeum vulgare]
MFPMFQLIAPDNRDDKCGHHYTICLDLKNHRFEVLDSVCSGDDATLTTQAEFFVNNMKQTCDCGFYMLEYLAKWDGRRDPIITDASVSKLCKIFTWNWVTNGDF